MFGYVVIDKPEMKIRDYYQYKGYYCGLCHRLREEYGVRGQMALTYDMTFAVILLTSLYEEETALTTRRCLVHPVKKNPGFAKFHDRLWGGYECATGILSLCG